MSGQLMGAAMNSNPYTAAFGAAMGAAAGGPSSAQSGGDDTLTNGGFFYQSPGAGTTSEGVGFNTETLIWIGVFAIAGLVVWKL